MKLHGKYKAKDMEDKALVLSEVHDWLQEYLKTFHQANIARYAITQLSSFFTSSWSYAILGREAAKDIKSRLSQLSKNFRSISSTSYQNLLSWQNGGKRNFVGKFSGKKNSGYKNLFSGYKRQNSGASGSKTNKSSKKF